MKGDPGGTARTLLVPPPPAPEPLAPAPLPRGKARREQRAPVDERQFLSLVVAALCMSLSERGESLSAVLVQLKISGHV